MSAKGAAAAPRATWFYRPYQTQLPYHSIRQDAYPGTPLIHARLGALVLVGRGSSEEHLSVKDAQGNDIDCYKNEITEKKGGVAMQTAGKIANGGAPKQKQGEDADGEGEDKAGAANGLGDAADDDGDDDKENGDGGGDQEDDDDSDGDDPDSVDDEGKPSGKGDDDPSFQPVGDEADENDEEDEKQDKQADKRTGGCQKVV
eukprot:6020363-Pleurochrysis_carterae.AAC.1